MGIEKEMLDPTIHGSGYNDDGFNLLRNHPTLVGHIVELLILWGANTDQKTIESYEQLLNYILKYVMKPEKASEFLSNIFIFIRNCTFYFSRTFQVGNSWNF